MNKEALVDEVCPFCKTNFSRSTTVCANCGAFAKNEQTPTAKRKGQIIFYATLVVMVAAPFIFPVTPRSLHYRRELSSPALVIENVGVLILLLSLFLGKKEKKWYQKRQTPQPPTTNKTTLEYEACPFCETNLSRKATICSNCGAFATYAVTPSARRRSLIISIIGAVLMFMSLYAKLVIFPDPPPGQPVSLGEVIWSIFIGISVLIAVIFVQRKKEKSWHQRR